ncbi:hypothetical protein KJ786_01535 [Patescibacteria group bacterium]|nr:hypothetical protein [Patescibacteria group bacterium]
MDKKRIIIIFLLITVILIVGILVYYFQKSNSGNGNIEQSKSEYQEINKDILPLYEKGMSIDVYNIVENFALTTIGEENGPGGAWVILKKEEGKWKEVAATEDEWPCDKLLKADISPSVLAVLLENKEGRFNPSKCTDYNGDGEEKDYEKLYQEK